VKRRIYGLVGLTWLTSKCLGNSLTHETRGGDTPWEISNKTSWRDTVAQAVFFFPHWKLIWTLPNNHDNHIYIYYILYIYIRIANHGYQSFDMCATKAGTSTNITTGTPVPRPSSSLVLFSSSPGRCPNPVAVTQKKLGDPTAEDAGHPKITIYGMKNTMRNMC
jgi:hypothetical protein